MHSSKWQVLWWRGYLYLSGFALLLNNSYLRVSEVSLYHRCDQQSNEHQEGYRCLFSVWNHCCTRQGVITTSTITMLLLVITMGTVWFFRLTWTRLVRPIWWGRASMHSDVWRDVEFSRVNFHLMGKTMRRTRWQNLVGDTPGLLEMYHTKHQLHIIQQVEHLCACVVD